MLEPYQQPVVLIYKSYCATSLNGTLISFFEIKEKPIMFGYISREILFIFMINPNESINSFLESIPSLLSDIENPLYLFQYDKNCLEKYDEEYKTNLVSYFSNFKQEFINDKRFINLEDFYSYALPECYYSFLTIDMYKRFALTKDFYEITNFTRSILFSKLVLIIDKFTKHKIKIKKDSIISISSNGLVPITLPVGTCLVDFQTEGLEEDSNIILMTLFKANIFITYALNELTEQEQFKEFIERILSRFDIVYVFNYNFEKIFFPKIKKFVDIKFDKYSKWASARKIVHLPYYHLEFDPGNGKNVPVWSKFYQIEKDELWNSLILQRSITNIITKLAILACNEKKIPFNDSIVADARRLIPSQEFLTQFGDKNYLLKKKICFFPIEYFNYYEFADGKYSEMYLDLLTEL